VAVSSLVVDDVVMLEPENIALEKLEGVGGSIGWESIGVRGGSAEAVGSGVVGGMGIIGWGGTGGLLGCDGESAGFEAGGSCLARNMRKVS